MEVHAPVQRDSEFQTELLHMKEEFENNLRTYSGDDPLNVWFEHILKVEDFYLSNGNSKDVIPLLEKCLQLFESDTRYTNDRRYCKLWIKYIDHQQDDPIELFRLLHSKNICIKCSDFYRAWSLYHELSGDFKQANMIFEMGKRGFAEPAEELDVAQKKLVFMAGLHTIHGPDEMRLYERKKELITLHRIKLHNQNIFYNLCQLSAQGLPTFDVRYLTNTTDSFNNSGAAAKQEVLPIPKLEANVVPYEGIRLYPDFAPVNHDDYSTWEVDLCLPDPDLPDKICMYEKHLVYLNNTEYSPEEIKARKYTTKKQEISDSEMTTEPSVKEEERVQPNQENASNYQSTSYYPNLSYQQNSKLLGFDSQQMYVHQVNEKGDSTNQSVVQQPQTSYEEKKSWQNATKAEENLTFMKDLWKDETIDPRVSVPKQSFQVFEIHEDTKLIKDDTINRSKTPQKQMKTPFSEKQFSENPNPVAQQLFSEEISNHENFAMPDPRVTPKNTPRKYLSQPIPRNSRENIRQFSQPEFAHPVMKNPSEIFNIFDEPPTSANFNESNCNTQVFNFNLQAASSSTPFNQKKMPAQFHEEMKPEDTENKLSKQRLFDNNDPNEQWQGTQQNQDKLSVILESTKELCTSSGSSSNGTAFKTTFNGYSLKTIQENSVEASTSKIYVQNPQQINQQINQDPSHLEPSFHLQSDFFRVTTPSPQKNFTQSFIANSIVNPSLNHSVNVSLHKEQISSQMKLPELPDQSVIYIAEDTNNLSNMRYADNSPSQFAKLQRKSERERFETREIYYDGSNDSNSVKDLWGRSPAKGSRMDIDVMSQNSNPDLRMDYDSCPEPPVDVSILLRTPSDPFSSKITKALLKKLGFPLPRHQENYVTLQKFPRFITKESVALGDERYLLGPVIGKGTYGQVFKATKFSTNEIVAMKVQKPCNQWEFYICTEIQHRIRNPHVLKAFMSIDVGYFCSTSSILVSEFCRYGSLLDLSNKVKQTTGKGLKEHVVIYFANEIITIINALHQCQIIHADIKPDNFLVTKMPPTYGYPCIQLIDFGCSIDMTLFPKGQTFRKVVNTENFTCPEMKDGRPWSYQTDLFCAAATVHVLLFEKYMQLQKKGSIWSINNRVPRYMKADLWNTFFYQMLNIESCDKLPDLLMIKQSFETIISQHSEDVQTEMRNIGNSVNGR